MAIIEKKIKLNLKTCPCLDVDIIENAIKASQLDPVRWAIVDMNESEITILANGIETEAPSNC